MQILVIGSGGREHALAWKLAQSNLVKAVFVAPGNPGTKLENKIYNIALNTKEQLIEFAKNHAIEFTIVGPEAPLADGIVDEFRAHNLKIWGPTKFCAQLESSKAFAKDFMAKHNIPTAKYAVFNDIQTAKEYLSHQAFPIVIKADCLAAGKGVLVAENMELAIDFLNDIFIAHKFGKSLQNKVVIEEFLNGIEASFIVMIDGKNILAMASSQDHKRLLNNDLGPNTGGMGAYSPAPIITEEIHQQVINQIIQPVIDGMHAAGHEYSGFLYAGLMIDSANCSIKTLEYNCRLGDPETQPIMFRLKTDLAMLIQKGLSQELNQVEASWEDKFALGVVLASKGYPDSPQKNDIISGINTLASIPEVKVFHSGTVIHNNDLYTAGGRVLCVVGMGNDISQAQNITYSAINQINFAGMQYRTDIGNKAI